MLGTPAAGPRTARPVLIGPCAVGANVSARLLDHSVEPAARPGPAPAVAPGDRFPTGRRGRNP